MELEPLFIRRLSEYAGIQLTDSGTEAQSAALSTIVDRARALANEDFGNIAPASTFRAEWKE